MKCKVVLTLLGVICFPYKIVAQGPAVLWATNVGGTLFSVDQNTNIYANIGGSVIKINSSGSVFQSNTICPLPGLAQRDNQGNYYFSGNFDGFQDFGGITLKGGWTNALFVPYPNYLPGYPTHFLAKYNQAGSLLWATSYGDQGTRVNQLTDLLVDSSGGVFAGHIGRENNTQAGDQIIRVTRFNSSGQFQWNTASTALLNSAVKLGGLTTSNLCFIRFCAGYPILRGGGRVNYDGGSSLFGDELFIGGSSYSKPVIDNLNRVFVAGTCSQNGCDGQPVLRKFALDGSLIWTVLIGNIEQWVLARDDQEAIYLGGGGGMFSKYNTDGALIWTTNYPSDVINMIVDSSGNRIVSFSSGSIARLASDPPIQPPTFVSVPEGNTTLVVGSNITYTAVANGTPPLNYQWRLSGTNIPYATNSYLNLTNLIGDNSGIYSLSVTNLGGSITGGTASLRVKNVQLFQGSQMLTSGTYVVQTPPTISVFSSYTNGSIFYTLDGSEPTFLSTPYSGSFVVSPNATIRALGFSADFFQSEESDSVEIVFPPPNYSLTTSSTTGGYVTLDPDGGTYQSNTVVTLTAVATNSWSFLYWLEDASGTNPSVSLSMVTNRFVRAVFGTTLTTTVAGNGQVLRSPTGGNYPFGTTVRLTGLPQPGNYFGAWGNAASGNTNPLYFTITNPTPTVSSIFAPTPVGQSALTLLITGRGRVAISPRANIYPSNQLVTISASPDAGENFAGWTGDASGFLNPIVLSMAQSRVVTANFTRPLILSATGNGLGLSQQGFSFLLNGETSTVYQIYSSTNLNNWIHIGSVSNVGFDSYFTDIDATNSLLKFYKASQ